MPFSASSAWIRSVFQDDGSVPCIDTSCPAIPCAASVAEYTACLLGHDALTSDAEFIRNVGRVFSLGSVYGNKVALAASAEQLRNELACACNFPLRFRRSGVVVRSSNPHNRLFMPPAAHRVVPACQESLSVFRSEWSAAKNDDERARLILVVFGVLLTIHPFADGNGRACRALFSGLSHSLPLYSIWLTLGLCLLYRDDAKALVFSLQGLRAGVADSLVYEFSNCVSRAVACFSGDVDRLGRHLGVGGNSDESGTKSILLSLRERVREAML